MSHPPSSTTSRGFSLVEALVAVAIFIVVLAIVFSFFVDYGHSVNTQSTALDQQTSARVSLDDIARSIQMCGYNIDRDPSDDPSTWQRDVVYAGSHAFAFNADIDASIGPIPSSVTVTFPTGDTYAGQGPASVTGGAETYVYTIDANDDGAITLTDRTAAATGSYNPAADTPNPLDFALFKKTYGYNGTDYGGTLVPVAGGLFTNATSAVTYPDGTTPEPIFEYWLTEDIDRSNSLANVECVVGTCPPTSTRLPKLYLWGDTDGDGTLNEAEKSFIRDKPVGSPAWSKNPLASGGTYKSTTVSPAFTPSSGTAYQLPVASSAVFGTGMYIQIDTGANTEYAVVESALSGNVLSLNADLHKSHAVGATVQIMPETLLRAVRAVKIQFDSISAKPDTNNGAQVAGRTGRAGTKGLDYQVRQYDKTVELTNLTTEPLVTASSANSACPLVTSAVCNNADSTVVRAFVPSGGATPINFSVVDTNGTPVSGVTLTFTKTNAFGTLTQGTGTTDSFGMATTGYTATALGDSTITGSGTCIDHYFNNVTYTDTILVKGTTLTATLSNDCLSTVSSRTAAPSASFTVQAQDSGGVVLNQPVSLSLQFDTAYLPPSPNYSNYQATLYIAGSPVGSTDSAGGFVPWVGDTGNTGSLSGAVVLNTDTLGNGARVNLVVSAPAATCWPGPANVTQPVSYLKLNLASANPSGCTETSPCVIPAQQHAPNVVGTLSINNTPVPGATVTFTKVDFHPAPDTPPASSVFQPAASAVTDSTGTAKIYAANNGSASITAANPLTTTVDATSTGGALCSSTSIVPVGAKAKFLYSGNASAGYCDADMQQAWVSGGGADVCAHVLDPNVSDACPLRPTGIKVAMYTAGGALDGSYQIKNITGGNITTTGTDCTTGSSVSLFTNKCFSPNRNLNNNEQYNFKSDSANGCNLPPAAANPGQYFSLKDIKFSKNVPGTPVRMDVTIYYSCDSVCSTSPGTSETFTLQSP
jgi:type II secretory pathway pseudopilin PulG